MCLHSQANTVYLTMYCLSIQHQLSQKSELTMNAPIRLTTNQAPYQPTPSLPRRFAMLKGFDHKVTEISYEQAGLSELKLLLPLMAQLSHQDKWIVWISPSYIPHTEALEEWGIDVSKILILHAHQINNYNHCIKEALSGGNCSSVFAWIPENGDDLNIDMLNYCARKGQSQAFVFKPKHSTTDIELDTSTVQPDLFAVN